MLSFVEELILHIPIPKNAREEYLSSVRSAVQRYKPQIEEKTGIDLGEICVKEYKHLPRDIFSELYTPRTNPIKRLLFYGLRGLVNAKTWYHEQKEPMLYHNSTIYVGFGNATRTDMQTSVGGIDSLIDQKIVHELLHALWDKLGGEKQSELHKDGINFLEGFTTYGDRYWLLDFYPEGYQLTDRGVGKYKVGVMKVKDLINQRGEGIFLRIPSEWKTLTVSHKP
jgi:hypothetical protein